MPLAHRPAAVVHGAVTRQITKTCRAARLLTDRLQECAKNMLDSTGQGDQRGDVSLEGGTAEVDEEPSEVVY